MALTPVCNAEYWEMTDIFQCEKSKTTCCSPKSAIFLSKKTKRLHLADKKNNEFSNFLRKHFEISIFDFLVIVKKSSEFIQLLSKKTQNIALGQQNINNLLRKHFEISAFEFEKKSTSTIFQWTMLQEGHKSRILKIRFRYASTPIWLEIIYLDIISWNSSKMYISTYTGCFISGCMKTNAY